MKREESQQVVHQRIREWWAAEREHSIRWLGTTNKKLNKTRRRFT